MKSVADAAMIAEMPTTAMIVWSKLPAVIPAPVAIPTLAPEVVARATVKRVAGAGMKIKPRTINE